ncbi:MAG: outer membrane porin, OprD family [Saprospiraceae bacterium]|nr:outer membrane porin, OprD family [Saprospiraceae bacterium]
MKFLIKFSLLLGFLLIQSNLKAQHQDLQEKPGIWTNEEKILKDSLSIISAFKEGKVNGHFRYFFSGTNNSGDLTDYYANAAGGGLRFETGKFHGFQFAVSGFYIFNIHSSDFSKKDPVTGQPNRYEIGLFDITNPMDSNEISRLEEFYLKYNFGKSNIIFGKQLINTPFINLQDGRMRPTQVEGLWTNIRANEKLSIQAGWFYAIAPRSTSRWYSIGESIGLYPTGINENGSPSGYKNNLASSGVALIGVKYKLSKNLELQAWDLYTDDIFNSLLLQMDGTKNLNNQTSVIWGAQFIKQHRVGSGGNIDPNKSYYSNQNGATTIGARLGVQTGNFQTTLNYNQIFSTGRYLMPREWGRDPFYTFLPRERNEGFGGTNSYMLQTSWKSSEIPWQYSLAAGYYRMPHVKNTLLNKYGMPSYYQINIDVRHQFKGLFTGLEAQLLLVQKFDTGASYNEPKYIFNKVDMQLMNFVLNFRF